MIEEQDPPHDIVAEITHRISRVIVGEMEKQRKEIVRDLFKTREIIRKRKAPSFWLSILTFIIGYPYIVVILPIIVFVCVNIQPILWVISNGVPIVRVVMNDYENNNFLLMRIFEDITRYTNHVYSTLK